MRVLLLHNPGAGTETTTADELVRLFEREGHAVAYRDVKEQGIDPADAEHSDVVVVAGGDGTVGKAVRKLSGAGRCIAIVPLGTANNIASCLGIDFDPERIARACTRCTERALDHGIAQGPWGRQVFLEGVGLGAIAELVAAGDAAKMSYEEEKRFGIEAPGPWVRAATPRRWRVAVDGQPLPEDLLLVEMLNMPLTGPRLPLGFGGWPDDRLLDVAFLRPEGRDEFAAWLDGDRTGRPAGLEVMHGRHVAFEWPSEPLRIDDHFPDLPYAVLPVEVYLADEQLRVIVPKD